MEIKSILKLKVNSEMEMKNHCLQKKEKRKEKTPRTHERQTAVLSRRVEESKERVQLPS